MKAVSNKAKSNEKDTRGKKRFSNNKRGNSTKSFRRSRPLNSRSKSNGNGKDSSNAILDAAMIESPVSSSSSLVFAGDSASMGSFGNMITTPGQDNFIDEFNFYKNANEDQVITFKAMNYAKRTANIMVMDFVPYFGCVAAEDGNWMSPIEMTALNLKQYIDTSFGTRTNYDPQDLAVYMMGVSAVFPMIAEIKRDLRLTQSYIVNQYPQFVPKGIFAALGIANDQGEWSQGQGLLYTAKNLRRFVDELNQLIITFNRLPMPPQISAFGYNDDLFDHLYADSPDVQTAQLYTFRLGGHWTYSEHAAASDTGSEVVFTKYPVNSRLSIDQKLSALASMISPLTALRTSSAAMLQNLFNAFGSRDTVSVPTLDMNALQPLDVVYDPNFNIMIENAVVYSEVDFSNVQAVATGRIRGAVGVVTDGRESYSMKEIASNMMPNIPLQFHKAPEQITKEDIGWALRLHPAYLSNKKRIVQMSTDAEAIAHGGIWSVDYTGFGFVLRMRVTSILDTGDLAHDVISKRNFDNDLVHSVGGTLHSLMDFSVYPILYDCSVSVDESHDYTLSLNWYYAHRDVELTYRLDDMKMHWVYLTMNVWGSNVNMNVVGSRTRN